MKSKITLVARILLGVVFFAGGLAGLLNLAPPPSDLPENMLIFNQGLMASGYFMPFLKATETLCGFFLLSGFYVPLALVILAPIVIHIVLVHAFLMPSGLPVAGVLVVLMAYLAFFAPMYSQSVKALFRKKP